MNQMLDQSLQEIEIIYKNLPQFWFIQTYKFLSEFEYHLFNMLYRNEFVLILDLLFNRRRVTLIGMNLAEN